MPPGQQLVDPINLVVGNATKNIGQPRLRIDTIELGRFDQRVGNVGSRGSAAIVGAADVTIGQ
jgi:hypothetical protein